MSSVLRSYPLLSSRCWDPRSSGAQELMRHSNSRTTLEVYSQARIREKREAQQRLVEMIMPDDTKIMMQCMGPDECLGDT